MDPSSSSPQEDKICDRIIPKETAHMLWFSGLRGAVSYGLVRMFPANSDNKAVFVGTTMFIILMTTFVLGSTTEYVLNYLKIEMNVNEKEYMRRLDKKPIPVVGQWLQQLEELLIRQWVVIKSDSDNQMKGVPPDDASNDTEAVGGEYQRHVEMTDRRRSSPTGSDTSRRSSVYDHGH